MKTREEIDRLNNIINELEKYLNEKINTGILHEIVTCSFILDKLKELKDSD